ncbi:MFS transporter [Opitutaceae bacterium TAV3]|nr:MFS transporter [Opitutaceae bacterium TAV3]
MSNPSNPPPPPPAANSTPASAAAPRPGSEASYIHVDPVTRKKSWTVGTLTYTTSGIIVLFLWLLWGDFSWSMRDRSVGTMAQWYLTQMNVSQWTFALLTASFPAALHFILGPIISMKSDRHRGKYGRRIPFLLVTTPFAAVGMLGLAATPIIARWLHAVLAKEHVFGGWLHGLLDGSVPGAWLIGHLQDPISVSIACFGVFWAAFEFATIIGGSVFGGLINDVVPKPLLGRFYGLFRAISLIDGIIFNFWLVGMLDKDKGTGTFFYFSLLLSVIGVFYGVAFMWVCYKVKEGNYPPPPPVPPRKIRNPIGNWCVNFARNVWTYCRECYFSRYYFTFFLFTMMAGLCFNPINVFAIRYRESLGIDMTRYGHALALTYTCSLCLSWFLGWMADRFHPLRMGMCFLFLYAVAMAWGACYADTPSTFLTAWVFHGIISGCYFTSAASLGMKLLPHQRYAQFASAGGLLGSIGGMAFAPAMGMIIDGNNRVGAFVAGIFERIPFTRDWGITAGVQNYRLTFVTACILALIALASSWLLYRQFMRLGGPRDYVAPEK